MIAFPLLSDDQIEVITKEIPLLALMARWKIARAIEAESRAPLLAEIERLSADVERLKTEAFCAGEMTKKFSGLLDVSERLYGAKFEQVELLTEQVERMKADVTRAAEACVRPALCTWRQRQADAAGVGGVRSRAEG